jgi:pilus assembly protein CpaB
VRSRLLTITLAVVLAVVGIVAVLAYVHRANERAVNGLKAESVVVAGSPIPAGTSLLTAKQENWLTTEDVPDSSVTNPVLSVTATNEHEVVSSTVAKGQVLLQNMLATAGTVIGPNSAVLPLPLGDIGVTMEMCLDTDVAGYVQPGSYIAVFDTVATGGNIEYSCTSHTLPTPPGKLYTTVVVPRVLVLSVTPASSASSSSSGGLNSSASNPSSDLAPSGEVLVTLAATTQAEAEDLLVVSMAGYPAYGLLTTGSSAPSDDPFFGFGFGDFNPQNSQIPPTRP